MPMMDSTGRLIHVGDRVRFRGGIYTIKAFGPLDSGYTRAHQIELEEPCHTDEIATEWSVDLVRSVGQPIGD